jgi:tetratricopeptide (TPR) repeat protein
VQLAGASPSGALQCVQRGLEAVGTLRARIGLRLRRAELQLRILESCALIDSGKADEAAEKLRDIETEAQLQLVGEDREEVLVAAVKGQARAVLASATEGSGFSVARLALERVLDIQPNNDWAYSQLGLIALRSGDGTATLTEARRCFEEAIKLKPDDASYHFRLGQVRGGRRTWCSMHASGMLESREMCGVPHENLNIFTTF